MDTKFKLRQVFRFLLTPFLVFFDFIVRIAFIRHILKYVCKNLKTKILRKFLKVFLSLWFEKYAFRRENREDWISFYWETMGVLRWDKSDQFSYEDIIRILKKKEYTEIKFVLELGCGSGDFLASVEKSFPHIQMIGLDDSQTMCEKAKLKVPRATILNQKYGDGTLSIPEGEGVLVARSTLTYVSEKQIHRILDWIASLKVSTIILSEPAGKYDVEELGEKQILRLSDHVWQRLYDLSTIRHYEHYVASIKNYSLDHIDTEAGMESRNKIWVFKLSVNR